MIRYRRGRIDEIGREQLEEGACECYRVRQNQHVRLLRRIPRRGFERARKPLLA